MEMIKKLWSTQWFKMALIGLAILLMVQYFQAFGQEGLYFEDTFLKKTTDQDGVTYKGKHSEGWIEIQVVEVTPNHHTVTYKLPNMAAKAYQVMTQTSRIGTTIEFQIDHKDRTVFKGTYNAYGHHVTDEEGDILVDYRMIFKHSSNQKTFDSSYRMPIVTTLKLALDEFLDIRGQGQLTIPAVFLLIFWAVDILYPRFFFTLQHFLSVRDPEPSDFFLITQKISWVVMPVVATLILLTSIDIL